MVSPKFYKIKHIATGLFYKPSGMGKSNLSKRGKVYQTLPSLKWIDLYYHPDDLKKYPVRPRKAKGEFVIVIYSDAVETETDTL